MISEFIYDFWQCHAIREIDASNRLVRAGARWRDYDPPKSLVKLGLVGVALIVCGLPPLSILSLEFCLNFLASLLCRR